MEPSFTRPTLGLMALHRDSSFCTSPRTAAESSGLISGLLSLVGWMGGRDEGGSLSPEEEVALPGVFRVSRKPFLRRILLSFPYSNVVNQCKVIL